MSTRLPAHVPPVPEPDNPVSHVRFSAPPKLPNGGATVYAVTSDSNAEEDNE